MASDAELLERLHDGTAAPFDALYRRYSDRVFRFALMMSGSRAIAEETTQETFAYVLEHTRAFNGRRSPTAAPWLLGIARNRLRAVIRNDARSVALEEELATDRTPEALVEASDEVRVLIDAIGNLSLDHREVLILCGLLELDYETAARTLGISIGTVRSRLSRARRRLAEAIAGRPKPSIVEVRDAI